MSELILHHYPESLYSEKVRLILGMKNLSWKSVLIPMVMPKPDLMPLTGGYRRTPILQIGNDVYCDTALIAETLERLAPQPSLYPQGLKGVAESLAQWGDNYLFWAAMGYFYQSEGISQALSALSPEMAQNYVNDRAALLASRPQISLAENHAALLVYLQRLQQMLEGGQPFLLGASASLADVCCYHPLWILQMVPATACLLQGYPLVLAWLERVKAIGHGQRSELSALEALAIAKQHPASSIHSQASDIPGIALGDQVQIMPSDYGLDPVQGELVLVESNHMAVRRHDERAGTVVVHFPRIGYHIKHVEQAS
ncbi:glutathione S-transferase family protein [Pseudomonas sp. N040]|uniref:glutathione S-transferase family protein n=1 Tax=Pseudomonas sp. N040 TaxID=2785325 RepID=UPI0018A26D95|nr:glutathione S-transferase family protein [Pseudomonas sp. N040]MBF7729060.1 glutathione S-transferase family protein [Pseudomonas sp. N040]MBW7012700.1 glutathione S-transferase family protein [Pseudomonas sp. N040]